MRCAEKVVRHACVLMVLVALGCQPDLGPCDLDAARNTLYYDDEGWPAYPGQALVDASCGGGFFCHSSGIDPADRLGAPAGLELDVAVAFGDTDEERAAALARLANARGVASSLRGLLYEQVVHGAMPPAPPDQLGIARRYRAQPGTPEERTLPDIHSPEGIAILRNWLACGAPVVEGVEGASTGIGDIHPRASVCAPGQAFCDGACVDVSSDPQRCGGCDVICASGSCVDGRCECGAGLTACGGECVDTTASVDHCGGCGRSCGDRVCADGACLGSCPTGTVDCDGACADVQTSAAHCGGCGNTCAVGQECRDGVCGCTAERTSCGGACVDTSVDSAHCGGCDVRCPSGQVCAGGRCACGAGTMDCGGACVDLTSDAANCGACGNACPGGGSCSGGACVTCGPAVSFSADVQRIFTRSCTGSGCHSGARPAATMSLEAGRSYAELVGVASSCGSRLLVAPGAVDASYLINKLTGTGMCSGTQMPKRDEALPPAEIDLIRSWICRGAPND